MTYEYKTPEEISGIFDLTTRNGLRSAVAEIKGMLLTVAENAASCGQDKGRGISQNAERLATSLEGKIKIALTLNEGEGNDLSSGVRAYLPHPVSYAYNKAKDWEERCSLPAPHMVDIYKLVAGLWVENGKGEAASFSLRPHGWTEKIDVSITPGMGAITVTVLFRGKGNAQKFQAASNVWGAVRRAMQAVGVRKQAIDVNTTSVVGIGVK